MRIKESLSSRAKRGIWVLGAGGKDRRFLVACAPRNDMGSFGNAALN